MQRVLRSQYVVEKGGKHHALYGIFKMLFILTTVVTEHFNDFINSPLTRRNSNIKDLTFATFEKLVFYLGYVFGTVFSLRAKL